MSFGFAAPGAQGGVRNPPGAMSATCKDMFVKLDIVSVLSLDATATAVEIHAGLLMALV
jgi:hypothetical protein